LDDKFYSCLAYTYSKVAREKYNNTFWWPRSIIPCPYNLELKIYAVTFKWLTCFQKIKTNISVLLGEDWYMYKG